MATIDAVKEALLQANITGWDENSWTDFYEAVTLRLIDFGQTTDVIAHTYIRCLHNVGVSTEPHIQSVFASLSTEELANDLSIRTGQARTLLAATKPQTQTCKLQYRNSCKRVDLSFFFSKAPEAIIDIARRIFDLAIPALQLRIDNKEGPLYASGNQFRDAMTLFVENLQIPMSKVPNMQEALRLCGPNTLLAANMENLVDPLDLSGHAEVIEQALNVIRTLQRVVPIVGGCETTRRIYIDPILYTAALIAGNTQMGVEKTVQSERVVGDVDFLLQNTEVPPLTVCVTEGKCDHHDKGVVQNIAQLSAVRETRKRDPGEIAATEPVFGIATTFLTWQFVVLHDNCVHTSKLYTISLDNLEASVTPVIARAASMLAHPKPKYFADEIT